MPLINVDELLSDPDFMDDLCVIRSTRSVGQTGRTTDSPSTFYTYGNVQPAKEAQLIQLPELERAKSYISVVTPFRLFALTDTTAADQVVWSSRTYRVMMVRDWTVYGEGFVEGICELITLTTDGPP